MGVTINFHDLIINFQNLFQLMMENVIFKILVVKRKENLFIELLD